MFSGGRGGRGVGRGGGGGGGRGGGGGVSPLNIDGIDQPSSKILEGPYTRRWFPFLSYARFRKFV